MQVLWWFARKRNRPDLLSEKEIQEWSRPAKADEVGWLPPVELFWMDDRGVETFPATLPSVWAPRGVVPIVTLRAGRSTSTPCRAS